MGDELLAGVGKVIRAATRSIDCPCRVGGDEFIVILPQTDVEGAAAVAERLRRGVLEIVKKKGLATTVSVSCGISAYSPTMEDTSELVEQSDAALYKAKQAGKNQVAIWQGALSHSQHLLPLPFALRQASSRRPTCCPPRRVAGEPHKPGTTTLATVGPWLSRWHGRKTTVGATVGGRALWVYYLLGPLPSAQGTWGTDVFCGGKPARRSGNRTSVGNTDTVGRGKCGR